MRKNKVHNVSAQEVKHTANALLDSAHDAAAVIQKSWRRHKARKNGAVSEGTPEVENKSEEQPPLNFPKSFHILSFDGGGAKGLMELLILKGPILV